MSGDLTMANLDAQIFWYDRRSEMNRRCYKALKVTFIILVALIPLFAGMQLLSWPATGALNWTLGLLGVAVIVIEGIQHLNQYQGNWIFYRGTCEALKHEKFLYLARAGPYALTPDAHSLLAERVQALLSQELAKWISVQEIADTRSGRRIGNETIERGKSDSADGAPEMGCKTPD